MGRFKNVRIEIKYISDRKIIDNQAIAILVWNIYMKLSMCIIFGIFIAAWNISCPLKLVAHEWVITEEKRVTIAWISQM